MILEPKYCDSVSIPQLIFSPQLSEFHQWRNQDGPQKSLSQICVKGRLAHLTSEKSDAETTPMHVIHPNTLSNRKTHLEENGAEVFGDVVQASDYEGRIAVLDQMLDS